MDIWSCVFYSYYTNVYHFAYLSIAFWLFFNLFSWKILVFSSTFIIIFIPFLGEKYLSDE